MRRAIWALVMLSNQASAYPCSHSHTTVSFTVRDSEDMVELADAVNCSGGSFSVSWVTEVVVTRPIFVYDGTVLNVIGSTDDGTSVIDGEGRTDLFQVYNGTLHLSYVTVTNASGNYWGAIAGAHANITAIGCIFSNNVGEGAGGSFHLESSNLHIEESTFTNNSAVLAGGAILAVNSTVTIDNDVHFSNNNSPGNDSLSSSGWGGAMYTWGSIVSVPEETTFVGNKADYGGAVFLVSGDFAVDGHILFAQNTANVGGGGVYGADLRMSIAGTAVWEMNVAIHGGGAFLYSETELVGLGNVTFIRNVAYQGAGFWLSYYSIFEVLGSSTFMSNAAHMEGGGAVIYSSTANFPGRTTFVNNTGTDGGCIIIWGDGNINVTGKANFSYNVAERGGVVAIVEGTSGTFAGNITMAENRATSSGGAIYAEATLDTNGLRVRGVRFYSNYAGVNGGAITMLSVGEKNKNAKIVDSIFDGNEAADSGGALFFAGGFVEVVNSSLTRNTAGKL